MQNNILNQYEIILASQSPRRKELLKGLGIKFASKVIENIEEKYPLELKAEEIVLYLARHKAEAYTNLITKNTIVITADTIVWQNYAVLEKPLNRQDAFRIISSLSGNKHSVYTGICLKSINKTLAFYDKTDVYFKDLSNDEIYFYIDNYKPYDKAGAYGIQEWIGYIAIERIEGSYFNVVGLPTHKLYEELNKFVEHNF